MRAPKRPPLKQQSEKYVERKICEHAKRTGWLSRKLQWIGVHGAPDRFFVKDGRIVLMEIKRPGGRPTEHQSKEIGRLSEAGVEVHLVDDIDVGIDILDRRSNFIPWHDDLI